MLIYKECTNMSNRKIATDFIIKHITDLEPSGYNTKKLKTYLDSLSDKEFEQYMLDLKNKKRVIPLYTPNMKIHLKMDNLLKVADNLKLSLFERLRLIDPVTHKQYLTPQKYLVLKLPIRRARQFLMHKLSVSESDKKTDILTGQVTGPDKSASISFVEAQLLYSRGLSSTLEELIKVRGGDIHSYANLKQQLEENGSSATSTIDPNSIARSTVVTQVILTCMGFDSNLVEGM